MNLIEAKQFINYGIKEGYYDLDQFENMTDEELIEFATVEEEKADMMYEMFKEGGE